MTTYVALSTINYSQNGYSVIAVGSDKSAVEQAAREAINSNESGVYADTMNKNLIVSSKSAVKREYGIDVDDAEYMCLSHADCVYL